MMARAIRRTPNRLATDPANTEPSGGRRAHRRTKATDTSSTDRLRGGEGGMVGWFLEEGRHHPHEPNSRWNQTRPGV
jgi:hypothetical protein